MFLIQTWYLFYFEIIFRSQFIGWQRHILFFRLPVFLMGVLGGLQVLRAHLDWENFEDPNLNKNLIHTFIPWGCGKLKCCPCSYQFLGQVDILWECLFQSDRFCQNHINCHKLGFSQSDINEKTRKFYNHLLLATNHTSCFPPNRQVKVFVCIFGA